MKYKFIIYQFLLLGSGDSNRSVEKTNMPNHQTIRLINFIPLFSGKNMGVIKRVFCIKKLTVIILALLFCACNNAQDHAKDVLELDMIDSNEISFDEWVSDVECFRLIESGTNFLLKIVEYDTFFYLLSFDGVFIFKKSGEHVRTITGNPFPNDIFVNEKEKQLWILDQNEIIKKYSPDGRFIEQQKLPFKAGKIAPAGASHFLFFEGNFDTSSPSFLRVFSNIDFSTDTGFVPKYNINFSVPITTFAYNSKETFIYLPYNDTIYVFDNTNLTVIPKWHLHFAGSFLTHHDIPKGEINQKREVEITDAKNKYNELRGVHIVNNILFMRLIGKGHPFRAVDITTNKVYRFNSLVNNINETPQGSTTDGLLLAMKTQHFIRHYSKPGNTANHESIKELLNQVKETDDGLIVLKIKLKEDMP